MFSCLNALLCNASSSAANKQHKVDKINIFNNTCIPNCSCTYGRVDKIVTRDVHHVYTKYYQLLIIVGNNYYGNDVCVKMEEIKDTSEREAYILMDRVHPPPQVRTTSHLVLLK